ncbi:MAG: glycosyltransferase family 39 protein, partial [Pusillimonas sp.]|nr:glycosyltransferase family 39 protein [Pusillimonas sp.]
MSSTRTPHSPSRSGASSITPTLVLVIYLLGMVALWTLSTAAGHRAPYLDGMEGLIWASSLEWGYAKHPPLPTWIMHVLIELFGREMWVSFFAGQLMSAVALVFVYLFGCEITSPRRALLATVMVSITMYFSLRSTIYNHNTAQLWSIAACIWLFYRSLKFDSLVNWIALGFVAALAMLTKYSALVQFAAFFIFMLVHGDLQRKSVQKGILAAAIVFVVVMLPNILWLSGNQFAPLRYANASMESSSYPEAWKSILAFVLDQLGRLSPMIMLWGALWYWQRRKPIETLHLMADQTYAGMLNAGARQFLLWVGLGPFVLTVLIAMALGTSLSASWGTTFFVLFGF